MNIGIYSNMRMERRKGNEEKFIGALLLVCFMFIFAPKTVPHTPITGM